jgi:uncharacterized protein (TIGR03437 family)
MSNAFRRRAILAVLAVLCPAAAWANSSGTTTLSANTRFSFDTGATVTSGGDILFTGTSIAMEGNAGEFSLGATGSAEYSSLNQATLSEFSSLYSSTAISGSSSLIVNEVFAVHTNGGNYAAVLITAVSSTSLSLQYTTFGVSTGPSGPAISAVQNNYSNILTGLPNYGIAPGSLFVIYGAGLSAAATAVLQSSASPGIPTTLNGASISVTVGGTTTHPGIYYAIPTQIAAVLPSGTPTGNGTITVSYGGLSGSAPIQVVTSALGLDTLFQTGTGLGVATVGATVINYNVSASPGQTVTLWGSGLGADLADSDTVYTSTPHSVSTPLQIYVGGILASIGYQGSSGYPGVNQINVVIPTSVQTGCGVSVVAVTGSVVSNTVTLPINPGGGVCSDSFLGITGTQLISESGTTTTPAYSAGYLDVERSVDAGMTEGSIGASFFSYPQEKTTYTGYSFPSLGNCIVIQYVPTTTTTTYVAPTGLDAGTISVTGPAGTQPVPEITIPNTTGPSGDYSLQPSSTFLPATFGTFTFTGSGGKDVGPFTASISYNNPLVWTNMSSTTSISRSQGVTINWTGGASGTYVYIYGSSSNTSGSTTLSVSFECYAPVSANQFTVPSYVLLALPPSGAGTGNGSLGVSNGASSQFAASGLSTGYASASAGVSFEITPTYQ